MLFYLIRHGVPDYATDTLTPLGQAQAKALAKRLSVHGLDRIYSSPLGRARETAQPTADALGLPVEIEEWASENLAWRDIACDLPDGNHSWSFFHQNTFIRSEKSQNLTWENYLNAPCFENLPNAASGFERVQKASDDFFARQGYVREGNAYKIVRPNKERVALFCHQGFSMEFLPVLLGIPPQLTFGSFDFMTTSVSIFHFENYENGYTQPRCLCLSDMSHIYEAGLPMSYHGQIDI